jgi:hypothetical protein
VWQTGKDTLPVTQNQCSERLKNAEYFANTGENLAKWQGSPSPMLPPCSKKLATFQINGHNGPDLRNAASSPLLLPRLLDRLIARRVNQLYN